MFNLNSKEESFEGFSYSKSIFLSSQGAPLTLSHSKENKYDILKQCFKDTEHEHAPFGTCVNWLAENKKYKTYFPPDIILDHKNEKENIKLQKLNIQKIFTSIKKQIIKKPKKNMKKNVFKTTYKNYNLSKLNSNTNKPCCDSLVKKELSTEGSIITLKYMKADLSKTFTQEYENDLSSSEEFQDSEKADKEKYFIGFDTESLEKRKQSSLNSHIESFNDAEILKETPPEKLEENSVEKEENYILPVILNETRHFQQEKNDNDETFSQEEHKPSLIINEEKYNQRKMTKSKEILKENETFHSFLDLLNKRINFENFIPAEYNLCYTIYIYMFPSQTDGNLLLFRRHEMKNLCKLMKPTDVKKIVNETNGDFLFDRRLDMVEIQSNVHICLEPLNNIYIKGLPYRILNIYSSSYQNIAKALSIMEEAIPEIMQTSVFKHVLPSTCSLKWSPTDIIVRPIRKPLRSDNANKTWFSRIDPNLRFPSFNYINEDARNNASSTRSLHKVFHKFEKNEIKNNSNIYRSLDTRSCQNCEMKNNSLLLRTKSSSNISEIFYESVQEGLEALPLENKKKKPNINNSPSVAFTCRYLKRIKCPASILQKDLFLDDCALNILFSKFHCKITKIEGPGVINKGTYFLGNQVKLSIRYHSKEDFFGFCNALGLCNKHK